MVISENKTNEFLSQFHRRRDRLVVRTLRCGRSNPGSNPGHGTVIFFFYVLYRLKLPYHKQKTFSFAMNENITKWLVLDHFLSSRSQFRIERLRFTFTPNGRREFVPRD